MEEKTVDLKRLRKNIKWGLEEFDGSDSSIIARSELIDALPEVIRELEQGRKKGNDIIKSGRAIQVGNMRIPVEVIAQREGIGLNGRLALFDFLSNDQCSIILDSMGLEAKEEYYLLAKIRALEHKQVELRIIDKERE